MMFHSFQSNDECRLLRGVSHAGSRAECAFYGCAAPLMAAQLLFAMPYHGGRPLLALLGVCCRFTCRGGRRQKRKDRRRCVPRTVQEVCADWEPVLIRGAAGREGRRRSKLPAGLPSHSQ